MQCIIFDSDRADARLIGIEYVITARLFATLDDEEKKLWHSHNFEARNGLVMAPGVPRAVELQYLGLWSETYGKNFHTWQIDRQDSAGLPLGIPKLMMAPCQYVFCLLFLIYRAVTPMPDGAM